MRLFSFKVGILGSIATGKMPDDARNSHGSEKTGRGCKHEERCHVALGNRTRATPGGWTKYSEVASYGWALRGGRRQDGVGRR